MAYASGGLISATDYNILAWGGTQGAYTNANKNIAYVMGVGTGATGYGQTITAINTVAAAATVTATQWSGLLTLLNGALGHQSGAGAQLSGNYTAGQTITYFANVATAVTTINTNAALYSAQGSTTTGANFDATVTSSTGWASTTNFDRTVTFASADHARYFFNAGGQLNLRLSTVNSADTGSESSFARLVTGLGGVGFKNTANGGRTGTGITLNTNNTALGYRTNVLNTPATIVSVTDTTATYTASTGVLSVYTSSADTTNGSVGLNVVFRTNFNINDKPFNDTLSLTYRMAVDIVYPESTYLTTNAWGTPTIS
jgi:hypothetical protein